MLRKSIVGFFMLMCVSCTVSQWATVKDVTKAILSASQVACILTTSLIQTREVLAVCDISEKYEPQVSELLDGKAQAKRDGVCR